MAVRLLAGVLLGVLLSPAPAPAQGAGPCVHQGRQVQCPPGLPPGSQSVAFVPGGTNWRNSATGAIVFVPSTTFPPFVASPTPTAPPGPTTQPGPSTSPGPGSPPGPGQPAGGAPTGEGQIYLTRPDRGDQPLPDAAEFRERLARVELEQAEVAEKKAFDAYNGFLNDSGISESAQTDPQGVATKDRALDYQGKYPATRLVVIRVTPEFRAASARYWALSNQHFEQERQQKQRLPYSDEFRQASRDFEATLDAAPVDPEGTERVQRAKAAWERATAERQAAQDALDDATGRPPSLERQLREGKLPGVQPSDVEKAPSFGPEQDGKPVDDVM
jgi:hypothetical protein